MQLSPRYGEDPVIVLDVPPADIAGPAVRQRRRLADALARLSDEQWAHPSRCAGWSIRDVVVHLDSTNSFWGYSVTSGVRSEPTQLLATFDPVGDPAALVSESDGLPASEVLERFVASTERLVVVLASLDDEAWSATAEAPPGHLSVSAVVHHALWDSWVHERDIFLPLDIAPEEDADEIAACLRYAAALGPGLAVAQGTADPARFDVAGARPEISFTVEIGDHVAVRSGSSEADVVLAGDSVGLVDGLSRREPYSQEIPGELDEMLGGLADAFTPDEN